VGEVKRNPPPKTQGEDMPQYRRAWLKGGTFFFTVVTYKRYPIFEQEAAIDKKRDELNYQGSIEDIAEDNDQTKGDSGHYLHGWHHECLQLGRIYVGV